MADLKRRASEGSDKQQYSALARDWLMTGYIVHVGDPSLDSDLVECLEPTMIRWMGWRATTGAHGEADSFVAEAARRRGSDLVSFVREATVAFARLVLAGGPICEGEGEK